MNELSTINTRELLAKSADLVTALSRVVKDLEPDALQMRAMMADGRGTLLAKIAAQELQLLTGYEIGQNRLLKWLRENGYIQGRIYDAGCGYVPHQTYINAGYFNFGTQIIGGRDVHFLKITQAGIKYLAPRIIEHPGDLKPVRKTMLETERAKA